MTDFVFLVTPQQIASAALVAVFIIVGLIACYILAGWVSDMIENYGDGLDNWHVTERRDDSDRH